MDASNSRKLLWAHFEGKGTPPQKQILREWLKNPRNHEVFFDVLHEWEKVNPQVLPDLNSDWEEILLRLESAPDEIPLANRKETTAEFRWSGFWLVAASVCLLVITGIWQREAILYKTYASQYGETKSFQLSDGSKVILNANSRLIYPRFQWLYSKREVKLLGEAEFSVVHTIDDRPFLVHTPDQLEVQVLGTEFMVYSRKEKSKVVLTKGKVRLRSLKTNMPPVNILPGDVVTINERGTIHLNKKEKAPDHLAWKEHRFVFNRTPLSDIALQIYDRFGVLVQVPDSALAATRLSGYYPAENADEMISMLSRLLNVHADKTADNVFILTN